MAAAAAIQDAAETLGATAGSFLDGKQMGEERNNMEEPYMFIMFYIHICNYVYTHAWLYIYICVCAHT